MTHNNLVHTTHTNELTFSHVMPHLSRPGMNRKCLVGMDLDASTASRLLLLHLHTHSNNQAHALPDTIPKRAQGQERQLGLLSY